MSIDKEKANAAIDEFLRDLANPDNLPTRVSCRTYIEALLKRHSIPVNTTKFGESHVVWYACLILTGRVRQVSRAERAVNLGFPGRTTENTIRRLRKGNLRTTIASPMLETILAQNEH